MRCLVTGGAGFIGSNLVDALVARGDEVLVVDNLATGRRSSLERAMQAGARLVELDVCDGEELTRVCQGFGPELVFHLAARIDVRRSIRDPIGDARVNVEGTLNALAAARSSEARRFVNTSTGGAIYGDAEHLPTSETEPPAPKAPYGQSKLAAEGYCALYRRLHGLSTLSLRYGNVYGPRQDPLGEAGVIAIFCGRVVNGGGATIFGDGRQTRDYVYVEDVVAANLAAAASDVGGSINIGRGVQTTIAELIEVLSGLNGTALTVEHAPERKGEVRKSALNASRAREALGWVAEVDVAEGLSRTVRWQRQLGPRAPQGGAASSA